MRLPVLMAVVKPDSLIELTFELLPELSVDKREAAAAYTVLPLSA